MYEYSAKILKILDGDTAKVELDLGFNIFKIDTLRIYNLNTKEIRKVKGYTDKDVEDGKRARDRARELLPIGKEVIIKTYKDKQGKYGRMLGDVIVDGQSFTEIMKEEGYDTL